MNLDDFKDQWAAYDKKLDMSIQLNARLLRESSLGKTRSALRWLYPTIVLDLLQDLALVILLGFFVANHFRSPGFLIPAILLDLFVIFHLAFGVYQVVTLQGLDFAGPILASQKTLATLGQQRIRVTMWSLLLAPLLWVPLLVVGMKALGLDAYAILDTGWLAANALFGIAVIPLMLWLAKQFGPTWQRWSWVRSFMDDIAGHNLKKATAFLDELAGFEREVEQV